jgi:SAM-dependent methyltransferase
MNPHDFVLSWLPPAPARVLEVGCGRGELARAMAAAGHAVVAIDPDAPPGPLFQAVSLEDFEDPGPFDVVVAVRSLHHVRDLDAALDKLAALLAPGAWVVLADYGWERMDHATAAWMAPEDPAGFLRTWADDVAGLHRGADVLAGLERRFDRVHGADAPYLRPEREPEEARLIAAGAIRALGIRWVGRARARARRA